MLNLARKRPRSTVVLQPSVAQIIEEQPTMPFHLPTTPYLLPKDEAEAQRLNFQHHLLKALLAGNYAAPLGDVRTVLDVGCGTGRWVIEMAQEFPSTLVVGLDIKNPTMYLEQPPNALFQTGDVLKGLPFADQSFDYVHQRLLCTAIPAQSWYFVIRELARVTRLNGWLELMEAGDRFLNAGSATMRLCSWWKEAARWRGFDSSLMPHLHTLMIGAGLNQVEKRILNVPLGKWGGRSGIAMAQNLIKILVHLKPFYCSTLSLKADHYDQTIGQLVDEWELHQTSYEYYLYYGQKGQE